MTFAPIVDRSDPDTMKESQAIERIVMASVGHVDPTTAELDAIAWRFLGSEFAGRIYVDWPIDRRIDAYLMHSGLAELINDGAGCNALLERVMANIGPALRNGTLATPHS
jgi:hypothetical protein